MSVKINSIKLPTESSPYEIEDKVARDGSIDSNEKNISSLGISYSSDFYKFLTIEITSDGYSGLLNACNSEGTVLGYLDLDGISIQENDKVIITNDTIKIKSSDQPIADAHGIIAALKNSLTKSLVFVGDLSIATMIITQSALDKIGSVYKNNSVTINNCATVEGISGSLKRVDFIMDADYKQMNRVGLNFSKNNTAVYTLQFNPSTYDDLIKVSYILEGPNIGFYINDKYEGSLPSGISAIIGEDKFDTAHHFDGYAGDNYAIINMQTLSSSSLSEYVDANIGSVYPIYFKFDEVSDDGMSGTCTCNKTFAEVSEAIAQGKIVLGKFPTNTGYLSIDLVVTMDGSLGSYVDDGAIVLGCSCDQGGYIYSYCVYFMESGSEFIITPYTPQQTYSAWFSKAGDNWSCSATFNDIKSAVSSNKYVFAQVSRNSSSSGVGELYSLVSYNDSKIVFSGTTLEKTEKGVLGNADSAYGFKENNKKFSKLVSKEQSGSSVDDTIYFKDGIDGTQLFSIPINKQYITNGFTIDFENRTVTPTNLVSSAINWTAFDAIASQVNYVGVGGEFDLYLKDIEPATTVSSIVFNSNGTIVDYSNTIRNNAGDYIVTFTASNFDSTILSFETIVCDKTVAEIFTAINSGQNVLGIVNTDALGVIVTTLTQHFEGMDFLAFSSNAVPGSGIAIFYILYTSDSIYNEFLDVNVSEKADKVTSATNGNFAGLDSSGNLTDSGKKPSDFIVGAKLGGTSGTDATIDNGKIIMPYATLSVGGVVKESYSFGYRLDSTSGVPYARELSIGDYSNYNGKGFIGKTTLENVLSNKVVRADTSQSLTDAQKTQARTNINASQNEIINSVAISSGALAFGTLEDRNIYKQADLTAATLTSVTFNVSNINSVSSEAELIFKYGASSASITPTGTITFMGDDCVNGVFTPSVSTQYDIMIGYNGTSAYGIVMKF